MNAAKRNAEKLDTALMALPAIDPTRRRLSDVVRLKPDALATRAAKFLTLADEYAKRRTFARIMAKPPSNVVPSWAKGYTPSTVRIANTWPSYRKQCLDAIYAAEGIAGLISVGAVEEIEIRTPDFAEAA